MKRMVLGVAVGLAAWFGSALAAEAQTITPTGPTCIYTGATGATYTADTVIPYLHDFSVQVYVYRGTNANPIFSVEVFVTNPTSLMNTISATASWNPGAITGEKFKFKANLIFNGQSYPAVDKTVTVTRPTTYLEPSRTLEFACEVVDRDRRREA